MKNTPAQGTAALESNAILEQLNAIEAGMKAAETTAFPAISLRTYAALMALTPVAENQIRLHAGQNWWIRVLLYGAAFGLARFILNHHLKAWQDHKAHPIAVRGILFQQRFVLGSALLTSFAFSWLGHPDVVFPLILIHLAFLFSSFSRFGGSILRWVAYVQAISSFAFLLLLKYWSGAELLPYFTSITAISLFLGSYGKKHGT